MNTDAESALGALVNRSGRTDQSIAPVKIRLSAPRRRLLVLRKPRRPRSDRRGQRGRRAGRRSWSADIAAAMTSRRPSRNDTTCAAAPASRSATARPRKTKRPRALGRQRPQSSFGRRSNLIGAWAKGSSPDLYFSFGTQSKNQPLETGSCSRRAPGAARTRVTEDLFAG